MKHSQQYKGQREPSIWGATLRWIDKLASRVVRFFSVSQRASLQPSSSPVKNIPQAVHLQEGETITLKSDTGVIREFHIIKKIAKGGFASIFLVSQDDQKFALKILDLWQKFPDEWAPLIARFNNSFSAGKINHENVIKYYMKGMYLANPFMIMEYCANGTLEDKMKNGDFDNIKKFTQVAIGILRGLKELHLNRVIHRDIKPKNILFDKDDNPKIADFDLSAFLERRQTVANLRAAPDIWYSPVYAPPEQTDPERAFEGAKPSMDLFAFSVSMFEILANKITDNRIFPWGTESEFLDDRDAFAKKVESESYQSIGKIRQDLSSEWIHALNQCLLYDPKRRIQTAQDFLQIVAPFSTLKPDPVPTVKKNGNWSLKFSDGCLDNGRQIQLSDLFKRKKSKYLLMGRVDTGKKNAADVSINEQPIGDINFISRKHATFIIEGKKLFIRDGYRPGGKGTRKWLPSKNGTFLLPKDTFEKIPVKLNQKAQVEPGDTIILSSNVKILVSQE